MKNLATNKETWLYLIKHITISILIVFIVGLTLINFGLTAAHILISFSIFENDGLISIGQTSELGNIFEKALDLFGGIISICCFIFVLISIIQKILARKYTKEKMWDNLRRLAYEDMVNW